jgi:hypothetical protein
MADKFLIKRKQDGFVFGPLTTEEANEIAGYPGEFEKLPDMSKPSRAGYDTENDGTPKGKASRSGGRANGGGRSSSGSGAATGAGKRRSGRKAAGGASKPRGGGSRRRSAPAAAPAASKAPAAPAPAAPAAPAADSGTNEA